MSECPQNLDRCSRGSAGPFELSNGREVIDVNTQGLGNQKKRMESDCLLSAGDYEAIFSEAPIGMALIDATGAFIKVNQAFCDFLGYTAEELIKKKPRDITYFEDRAYTEERIEALIQGSLLGTDSEKRYLRKDGKMVWGAVRLKGIRNSNGAFSYGLGMVENINDRKLIEQRLECARKEAETANQTKSRFLAEMSHEIRTPLSTILGYVRLLAEPSISGKERNKFLEKIDWNASHLRRVIDDILDLSRVESGRLDLRPERLNHADLIQEIIFLWKREALRKGLSIETEFLGPVPKFIYVDPVRFRQVLGNLIHNAVKYTKTGGVRILMRMNPRLQQMEYQVQDTGRGIEGSRHVGIFQPFYQANGEWINEQDGVGLGLSLSRALAREMGGGLELVKSVPQAGSCFSFRVNVGEEVEKTEWIHLSESSDGGENSCEEQVPTKRGLEGMRLLLVEDSFDLREIISLLLGAEGATIDTAENGQAGLEKAQSGDYHAVLLDIQMPIMNGIEMARRLKAIGYQRPMIALTARLMKEERERSMEAGCFTCLSKPFDVREIVEVLKPFNF